MTRLKLTDLTAVRELTAQEQADVRGGALSWAAIAGIALAGTAIYKGGAYLVRKGYEKKLRDKWNELLKMAPNFGAARRQSNCVTWYDGSRNCYA